LKAGCEIAVIGREDGWRAGQSVDSVIEGEGLWGDNKWFALFFCFFFESFYLFMFFGMGGDK